MAVFTGNNSGNTLNGTSADDTLSGLGGNDTLNGGAGNDTLNGASGDDTLNGGENSDTYLVGPGDGFDRYADTGMTGIDRVRATAVNTVIGIKGHFSAANGIEQIDGNGYAGVIILGDGSSNTLDFSQIVLTWIAQIDAGAGSDTVIGSTGNDTIVGGLGSDSLNGGDGSDTYLYSTGDGKDTYGDTGASGYDRILVTAANTVLTLSSEFGTGIEEISANGFSGVTIDAGGGSDILDFSQTLLNGIARVDGGSGSDSITGSVANDTILGGDGSDTLRGHTGNDTLFGGAGNDTLLGGADNDTLIGGGGNDLLDGGDGSDTYLYSTGDGRDFHIDTGASGFDRILVTGNNTVISFASGFVPGSGIEEISANGFSGVTIDAGGGSDTLDFSLTLLTGIASIEGGGGADFITGSTGDDTIRGGDGSDVIQGNGGNDRIFGGSGTDTLHGDAGDDLLTGGAGIDVLDGGDGSDTYRYSAGDGRDIYADTGASGFDRIVVQTSFTELTLSSGFGPSNGIEDISADGHAGVTIKGSSADNTLDFSMTMLTGIAGIDAGGGDDIVAGSSNDDTIHGGNGKDVLKGGGGNDHLYGDGGLDTAVFDGSVHDFQIIVTDWALRLSTIIDLAPGAGGDEGTDWLDSIGHIQFNDYKVTLLDNNVVVAADDTANTTLNTPVVITASSLTANDFDFDADALKITSVGNGVNGSAVLNPDGTILFTPTAGFTGEATFDYTVSDGHGSTDTGTVTVTIAGPVGPSDPSDMTASAPTLTVQQSTMGGENTAIPLVISAALTDTDGSETLTLTIDFEGPPIGAVLSDGVHSFVVAADNTTADITGWDLSSLTITQAANSDQDLILKVTATSTESNGGATTSVSEYVAVTVVSEGTGVELSYQLESLIAMNGIAENGFRLDGPIADQNGDGFTDFTEFGLSVSGAGDLNGDGFADMIVGARSVHANGNEYSGASYVVFGGPFWFSSTLSAGDLGPHGFRLDGIAGLDNAGYDVSGGGDINGDGHDDLIISAPFAGAGRVYVSFGHSGGYATASLAGAVEFHDSAASQIGLAVGNAGDINGDGVSDLIIGRTDGAAVVYGSQALSGPFDLATLDGANGFIASNAPFAGSSVSGAGDVNGDGFDDVIIGTNIFGTGDAYVVFGGTGGVANVLLDALDGNTGFRMTVADAENGIQLGATLSSAGDVNGDGFGDLIVGAAYSDTHNDEEAGISYVVFGKAGGFDPVINVDELDGTNGFRIDGAEAGDRLGIAVSNAGDFNGDGYDDLIVATQLGGNTVPSSPNAGQTYVVFGNGTGFAPTIDLASLPASEGVRLDGGFSIASVSAAGDVNGDGFDDIMIGAPNIGFGTDVTGVSYVIFGGTFQNPSATYGFGTTDDDVLAGVQAGAEIVMGGLGNDELSGGAGDVLNGGAEDDLFHFTSGIGKIVGGSGFDTLKISGDFSLTDINATAHYGKITGIEQIDIADGFANELVLTPTDLLHLSKEQHEFFIVGDDQDQIDIGGGWTQGSNQTIDGTDFKVYVLGVTTLFVEAEIDPLAA